MIPKIIHQTWKGPEVPPDLRRFQASWLAHNPDWEYRFWTDASTRRFVAEHYPDFLPIYDAYRMPIMRVDAARYLWMLHFGGVYADLDFECLRPLEATLAGKQLVLGLEPQDHVIPWIEGQGLKRLVGNAFLASAPGHSLWPSVIAAMQQARGADNPLVATGPILLSRAVEAYAGPEPVTLLAPEVLYPADKIRCWESGGRTERLDLPAEAVAVHHWAGTWWRLERPAAAPPRGGLLIATPVKNARKHLPRYVENLDRLGYPHERLSLALLESDSDDGSFAWLESQLESLRRRFRRVELYKQDFGFRHDGPRTAPAIQLQRRSILARSRNHLLQRALRDETWVLWLDADVIDYPPDVIERLLATGKRIVVPHCVDGRGRTFDLNTFQLGPGAAKRDWKPFIIDGIVQPPRGLDRLYLEDLRAQPIVPVDAVGGTMLLVSADLHRDGLIFPPFSYKLHIETEGLAVMARDMGHRAWGLPNLEIVHA